MNTNDNMTFYELIQEKRVEIPIIQRDYAQGREGNREICRNFLKAIRESVENESAVNLDFVYGNVKDDVFYPLDGQQRLTTLFLLHWYACMKERPEDMGIRETLSNFTYETRLSSRRFCKALVSNVTLISASNEPSGHACMDIWRLPRGSHTPLLAAGVLTSAGEDEAGDGAWDSLPERHGSRKSPAAGDAARREREPSGAIEDAKWFFASWRQDSTIRAMLNTIDMIHELFFEVEDLWGALVEKKLVTFHLLILEDFGLSDDLYIKMNARGRLLTPFENLKAEILDKAQKGGWKWEEALPLEEKFSYKMDREWTDFIWDGYRKNDLVDEPHMNFITTLVMFRVAKNPKLRGEKRADVISQLNENHADRRLIHYIDEKTFEYIYKCYELYANAVHGTETAELGVDAGTGAVTAEPGVDGAASEAVTAKPESGGAASRQVIPDLTFDMWRHRPEKNLLYQILVGNRPSYTHKVLFYAQTEYLLRNEDVDKEKFLDWMRVVRNIVSRANITPDGKRYDLIRSPEAFGGVMDLVRGLARGCGDIYHYLNTNPLIPTYAKEQMREERIKARIICANPAHKQLLFDLEDNELLRGRILFALQCAGYRSDIAEIDLVRLAQIRDVFKRYFNKELETGADEFDLLRRAMLTIEVNGEYCFYKYWWSYWYAGDADKRKLFPVFREMEDFVVSKTYGEYFAKLVDLLIDKDYQEMIDGFVKPKNMENWQYRLIKEGDLLKNCKSKYLAIPEDGTCCYLLKSKRTTDVEGSPKVE